MGGHVSGKDVTEEMMKSITAKMAEQIARTPNAMLELARSGHLDSFPESALTISTKSDYAGDGTTPTMSAGDGTSAHQDPNSSAAEVNRGLVDPGGPDIAKIQEGCF